MSMRLERASCTGGQAAFEGAPCPCTTRLECLPHKRPGCAGVQRAHVLPYVREATPRHAGALQRSCAPSRGGPLLGQLRSCLQQHSVDECWGVVVPIARALGFASLVLALADNAVQQADKLPELPPWDGAAGHGPAGAGGHCVLHAMVRAAGGKGGERTHTQVA